MERDLALICWILLALTLPLLLGALALTVRRVVIRRPGGAISCSLRRDGEQRWRHGVAAYRTGQLAWFPAVSVWLTPDLVVARQRLQLTERRVTGAGPEAGVPDVDRALPVGTVVARFRIAKTGGADALAAAGDQDAVAAPGETIWLAMTPDALTGLLAWIEAAPQRWRGEGVLDRPA